MTQLLITSKPCSQCLTTRNRIVSGERAAEIIRDCRASGEHFFCHKGTMADRQIHCRGVHDLLGSHAHRFAVAVGIPVVQVDPETIWERSNELPE